LRYRDLKLHTSFVMKTAALQVRVDASCSIRPQLRVRPYKPVDLSSRQVEALIPQCDQRSEAIAKKLPAILVVR
jgi:hypothetical protein